MPNKNNLSSIKLESKNTLKVSDKNNKKIWRPTKPLQEKCSESVALKFTPSEMAALKKLAGLVPLATLLKDVLKNETTLKI